MLTVDEEQFVKELYSEDGRFKQREALEEEMWGEVEVAKAEEDWDEIQKIKKKYRKLIESVE